MAARINPPAKKPNVASRYFWRSTGLPSNDERRTDRLAKTMNRHSHCSGSLSSWLLHANEEGQNPTAAAARSAELRCLPTCRAILQTSGITAADIAALSRSMLDGVAPKTV